MSVEDSLTRASELCGQGRLVEARDLLVEKIASLHALAHVPPAEELRVLLFQLEVVSLLRWSRASPDASATRKLEDGQYARSLELLSDRCLERAAFDVDARIEALCELGASAATFERYGDASGYFKRALDLELDANGELNANVNLRSLLVGALLELENWVEAFRLAKLNYDVIVGEKCPLPQVRTQLTVDLVRAMEGSGDVPGAISVLEYERKWAPRASPVDVETVERWLNRLRQRPGSAPNPGTRRSGRRGPGGRSGGR